MALSMVPDCSRLQTQRRGAITSCTPNFYPMLERFLSSGSLLRIPGVITFCVLLLSGAILLDSSTFLPLSAGFPPYLSGSAHYLRKRSGIRQYGAHTQVSNLLK